MRTASLNEKAPSASTAICALPASASASTFTVANSSLSGPLRKASFSTVKPEATMACARSITAWSFSLFV